MYTVIKSMVVMTGIACLLCMRASAKESAVEVPSSQGLAAASRSTSRAYTVTILFDGPWAFYKDVANKRLLAIAPEVPGHPKASIRGLKPAPDLDFGVYDLLSLPVVGPGTPQDPPDLAPISTSAAQFAQILKTPSSLKRYVVVLPLPDDIIENLVDTAKVDVQYQPTTMEKDYATELRLLYTLTSLSGVTVAGKDNSGKAITPIPLTISNEFIHIRVGSDFINDDCDTHAKVAFKDLSTFLGSTWYVDFPPYDPKCPKPLEEEAVNLAATVDKVPVKRSSPSRVSPDVMAMLVALRGYLVETVKVDFARYRLLSDVAIISEYLQTRSAKKPAEEKTRKALNAAMDLRAHLKSLPDKDERTDVMRKNLAAITVHIFNTGGKNCKAPLAWVTVT